MVSLRGLKPKKHQEEKGQAQKLTRKEERKRKEAYVRRLKKKAELGSSETAKGSRSPRRVNIVKKGLRQFKRKRQKGTQETEERAHPSQVLIDPARKRREKLSDFS